MPCRAMAHIEQVLNELQNIYVKRVLNISKLFAMKRQCANLANKLTDYQF